MRKIFNLVWCLGIIILSTSSFTSAYTQEQKEAYQWAYRYGITTQPTVEAANLDGNLTRQAFSKMVVNYLENTVWVATNTTKSCYFLDENKFTSELKSYAKKTCAYDIMWSDWTNFNPTQPVNRAQLWTVLSRILWWDEYNNSWKWYYIYHLNALKQSWIMNNINNPQAYAKRWDVLIMLKRLYEKYGMNISMNWVQSSAYGTNNNRNENSNKNTTNINQTNDTYPSNDDYRTNNYEDSYIGENSDFYSDSNIIYTAKDWTKYSYDIEFISILKDNAIKQWETDLVKYLEIEADYFEDGLSQVDNLDLDNLPELLGIDEDVDPETMTAKEKEELLKKIKEWVNKIIKENKNKNDTYINNLEKVTKKINNDKFWLKDKYKETKSFIDATNSFLELYSEMIFNIMELSLTNEEEIDDWEALWAVFWLMWSALAYQWVTEKYQTYLEEWWTSTTNLLELN